MLPITSASLKIDQLFSSKNRISYFQSLDSQLTHGVSDFDGPLGTALGNQYQKPRIFRVNHDYTFSPTVLLHTHLWILANGADLVPGPRRPDSRPKSGSPESPAIPMRRP